MYKLRYHEPVLPSLYPSLTSFSYFTFPGPPNSIFIIFLPWLPCHFYPVVEQQQRITCVSGARSEKGQRIIKLHERAVEILYSEFCHPDVCIFKDVKLLKFKDMQKLCVGVYMFKVIKLNKCTTLQIIPDLKYPQHDYFKHKTRNYFAKI